MQIATLFNTTSVAYCVYTSASCQACIDSIHIIVDQCTETNEVCHYSMQRHSNSAHQPRTASSPSSQRINMLANNGHHCILLLLFWGRTEQSACCRNRCVEYVWAGLNPCTHWYACHCKAHCVGARNAEGCTIHSLTLMWTCLKGAPLYIACNGSRLVGRYFFICVVGGHFVCNWSSLVLIEIRLFWALISQNVAQKWEKSKTELSEPDFLSPHPSRWAYVHADINRNICARE